jgi:hypothetical protein
MGICPPKKHLSGVECWLSYKEILAIFQKLVLETAVLIDVDNGRMTDQLLGRVFKMNYNNRKLLPIRD